jgi:hypothetical protein
MYGITQPILRPILHPILEKALNEKIIEDLNINKNAKNPEAGKEILDNIKGWMIQAIQSFPSKQVITEKDIENIKEDFGRILQDIEIVLEEY